MQVKLHPNVRSRSKYGFAVASAEKKRYDNRNLRQQVQVNLYHVIVV